MPLTRNLTTTAATTAGAGRPVGRWPRRSERTLVRRDAAQVEACGPVPAGAVVLVDHPEPRRSGPPRVVAAVRDLPAELAVLDEAADLARGVGAEVVIAHAVPLSFGEHSVGLTEAVHHGREVLQAARQRVADQAPDLPVSTTLARRWAHELLGEDLDADLLVLGGWRVDRRDGLGLVARSAVQHAPCPVLLVPRD